MAKNGSENGEELPSETSEGEESSNESESDEEEAPSRPVSVIDIVAKRKVLLHQAKVQIGSMSSSFLEMPEERLHILQKLLKMMSGQVKGQFLQSPSSIFIMANNILGW